MSTSTENRPAVGLVLPQWIEDWNNRSREEMGGEFGYSIRGVSYFARSDFVDANLPTRRNPKWQVVRKSQVGLESANTESDDPFILMPDVVRTTFPAPSSQLGVQEALAQHLRDVLVNSHGESDELAERHIRRMKEQLHPTAVIVNDTRFDGWQADELPHVTVLGAEVDNGRIVSVVIDRTIASSLSLQLVDFPER